MNEETITSIFGFISKTKEIKKQKLFVLKKEERAIIKSYFLYKIYRFMNLWKFRNAVLNNQIDTQSDIITSIDDVIYKIIIQNG